MLIDKYILHFADAQSAIVKRMGLPRQLKPSELRIIYALKRSRTTLSISQIRRITRLSQSCAEQGIDKLRTFRLIVRDNAAYTVTIQGRDFCAMIRSYLVNIRL
jgi:RIO-like serine/threonine protein kinase